MKALRLLALALVLPMLPGCDKSGSPTGGNDEVHAPATNEMGTNTAVSIVGPEGNATNASSAALGVEAPNDASPDYNVAALDARPENERGSLGGRHPGH
jgi:hypothetical protein